jgi:hypothetical protein
MGAALPIAASMDIDHHRLLLAMRSLGGYEYVQKQAVFRPDGLIVAIELWANVPECRSIPRPCPWEWWLWRLPSQLPHGWLGVRDSTEDKLVADDYTLNRAGLCLGDRVLDV